MKILLVEHNPDHILFARRIIEKLDGHYQLDSVTEAKEGLRRIDEINYDLVLCDCRMPDMTALDILRRIRNKGKDLPFIVVTSSGNEKVAVDLMKEGAYDYIVKDLSYESTLPVVIKRSIERFNANKERENLEKKIKRAAEEWEATFNAITDSISIHDENNRIVRANKACANMFRMNQEEIIGKICHEVFHGSKSLWANCLHKEVQESKKTVTAEFFDSRLNIYIELSVSSIFNDKSQLVATVHVAKDITKRKKEEQKLADAYQELKNAQEQLMQSSKMAAMGQLAAGISHELNQPLSGIKGFAQSALMDAPAGSVINKDLKKIVEQADRMDAIIKNIRFFARKSEFKMEELDINKPIEDSLMLLNEQLKVHNIRFRKDLDKDLPRIKGDSNQLQQVFLNLITNARDAIDIRNDPSGGELIIKTALSEDKKSIEIFFEDSGCGIPGEDMENIFNPFFTTKSPDGGIGLGLSIVYRIIENHKGRIEAESKLGKGTVFKIALPVERKEAQVLIAEDCK